MKKKVGVFLTAVLLIFSSVTVIVPCSVGATYHQEVKQSVYIKRLGEVFTVDLGDGFSWSYNFTSKTLTFNGNGMFPIRPESCIITEENSGGRYDSTYFLCDRGDVETLVVEDGITDLPDLQGDVRPYYRVDNIIVGKDCKSVPKVDLSYEIDPKNPYFASYDGALYNKDLTKLLYLPSKKTSVKFPSSLHTIGDGAIINTEIDRLIIPWGVTTIEGENFYRQTSDVIIPDTLINHSDAKIESPNGFFTVCSENNQERKFWQYGATQAFGPINATEIVYQSYGITPNSLKTFQNGKTYYFDQSCKMAKGWKQASGNWYYFNDYGAAVVKIWLKSGNKWYFMQADGTMATNKWIQWYNKWYYVGSDGAMYANRWIKSSGKWYYLGSDGAMYANRYTPDGYWVNANGVWVQ